MPVRHRFIRRGRQLWLGRVFDFGRTLFTLGWHRFSLAASASQLEHRSLRFATPQGQNRSRTLRLRGREFLNRLMPFEYNDQEWPLVIIEAKGESSDEDLDLYIATLTSALARQQRHVIIVDATRGQNLKGTHRKRVADWNRKNEVALSKYRAGLVLVTESSLLRGLITAVHWLSAPAFPYKAVSQLDEARLWAQKQLSSSPFRRGNKIA